MKNVFLFSPLPFCLNYSANACVGATSFIVAHCYIISWSPSLSNATSHPHSLHFCVCLLINQSPITIIFWSPSPTNQYLILIVLFIVYAGVSINQSSITIIFWSPSPTMSLGIISLSSSLLCMPASQSIRGKHVVTQSSQSTQSSARIDDVKCKMM